ncbi:beta-ribofuranosylaminobenzene 5'-phosphate synthase family protein [Methylophaga sp. UBA2689]|jgi:beta-ribofuranosylaminobenzene 5'-phosphate synthase|uniref:beta-ribofuranosylaminobenzene 5'-phosphate synthase family protein n=1 Tax=Methylophaga sp. UBA2689 TaxID=1946878 RepID=UPI0025FCAFF5|nr:beta-ribofuranosylaminobenzene 5'-phosphate synthase family protein [Methylophaga sp. UBA2689]
MQKPVSPVERQTICVQAPARLHLGFLDLNGGLGRHFGSIGLAVDSHHTKLSLSDSDDQLTSDISVTDSSSQKITKLIKQFYLTLGANIPTDLRRVSLTIHSLIPEHAGLGSGTQLALVIGQILAKYHQLDIPTEKIALAMDRGKRSGIGISTFDTGGFVVDAGLGPNSQTPVRLFQQDFPSQWRLVMLMDKSHQGIHGQTEIQAFQQLPTFPLQHSQRICHLTLMQLLPALIEQDIQLFGSAVSEIQALIGQHFAPAQGGQYTSKAISILMEHCKSLGFTGMAQSSWGPTSCVFTESQSQADFLIDRLRGVIDSNPQLQDIELITTAGVNKGAGITIDDKTLHFNKQ